MELIAAICDQTGLSRYVVKQVLDVSLEHIATETRNGETVIFPGFGRFQQIEGKDGVSRLRLFAAKRNTCRLDPNDAQVLQINSLSA